MAKKNYYAVKKGLKTGIFKTWRECQQVINGYSGAEYQGFFTKEEAERYLMGDLAPAKIVKTIECIPERHLVAYVDGSYDDGIKKYSFGCIIIQPNGEIIKEYGNGNEPASLAIRNVAGELLGAMYAVKWAMRNEYKSIELRYDYEGIEKWVTGEWKAKNELAQKYATFMKECEEKICITFEKVVAHTGDYYNEEVDKLAKVALTEGKGIPKIKKGDFWFIVEGISYDELKTIIQLVKEEIGENIVIGEESSQAYCNIIALKINNKDRVVVKHYEKGNKIVMQGKPLLLFSSIISYVTELVEVEEIPKIFNNTYSLDISKEEVISEFQFYMPNSYNKLASKISKTLHQAVYNLKLNGDMFDGTFLAQPVIRVVEAHLKTVMIENEVIPDWKYIKDNGFDMFEKLGAKYKLNADRYGIATENNVKYIGNCYTFYNINRHKLSHWDDPTAPLDTTKLLKVDEAHDLIKRALSIIDEYYEVV
jgi:Predicted double-stranded RNA/RNA-DNA hybrid binding protein